MTKRFIAFLFTLLLAVCVFAGCGTNETNTSGTGTGTSGNEDEEEYFLDVPAELKGTTVKYATWIDHYSTESAAVMANFEDLTGIHVELVNIPQSEYCVKVASLVAADQAPDFVVDNGDFPRTLAFFAPLNVEDNCVDPTWDFWDPAIVKRFTVGKYVYALNNKNTTWNPGACVYYNSTVFEENGVKTPSDYVAEDDWNLDTFWTCMTQLQQCGAYAEPATVIDEFSFVSMYGIDVIGYDSDNYTFTNNCKDPRITEAYQYLLKGKEAKILYTDRNCRDNIANGRGGLTIYGVYGLRKKPGWYYNMNFDDLAYEYLPKIHKEDANYPRITGNRAYGVCKGAKNPKGAGYFLRYYTNTDFYNLDDTFKNTEAQEMYEKLCELPQIGLPSAVYGVMGTTYNLNSQLFEEVVNGSYAQISTNLSALSNKIDACIDLANGLIKTCIDSQ